MSLWRRFRALPAGTQAAAWIGVAAVYTVALVLILGGGGSDDEAGGGGQEASQEAPAKPMDAGERKIAEEVEGAKVKVAEPTDVGEFRQPEVRSVDCEDGACTIEYTSGLPGRGRIFEDQQQILARIFEDDSIDEVTIKVYRGGTVGPGTPAKKNEETAPGTPILVTQCKRTGKSTRADAGEGAKVPAVPADCQAVPIPQGPNQAKSDAPSERSQGEGDGGAGILGDG